LPRVDHDDLSAAEQCVAASNKFRLIIPKYLKPIRFSRIVLVEMSFPTRSSKMFRPIVKAVLIAATALALATPAPSFARGGGGGGVRFGGGGHFGGGHFGGGFAGRGFGRGGWGYGGGALAAGAVLGGGYYAYCGGGYNDPYRPYGYNYGNGYGCY
jgi:hypothetical protein